MPHAETATMVNGEKGSQFISVSVFASIVASSTLAPEEASSPPP
jgi:hypothetical protein